jgi:hypothetical protein
VEEARRKKEAGRDGEGRFAAGVDLIVLSCNDQFDAIRRD